MAYPRDLYNILFQSAWETLESFAWNHKYLGAQLGATMVLHTWGSNLSYHPHVHCIVPGGGVGKYLFPVKALSEVFRGKYMHYLQSFMEKSGMDLGDMKAKLRKHKWVVYCKPPPTREGLVGYLARYTHQIAITPSRILSHDPKFVTLTYKDYRHGGAQKPLRLSSWEFVRRFAQHILPHGFTRIRHCGILHSSWKARLFPGLIPPSASWMEFWAEHEFNVTLCPECMAGRLIELAEIPPQRGPPSLHLPGPSQNQSLKELVS